MWAGLCNEQTTHHPTEALRILPNAKEAFKEAVIIIILTTAAEFSYRVLSLHFLDYWFY